MAAAILILVLWLVAEIYLMFFLAKFIGGLGVFIILLIGVLAAIFYWKRQKVVLAQKIAEGKSSPEDLQKQAQSILFCFLLAFPTLLTDVFAFLSLIPQIKNRFSGVFSQAIQKTPLAEQMNVSAQREDGTKVSGELMEKNNAGKHSGKKKKRRRYGKK